MGIDTYCSICGGYPNAAEYVNAIFEGSAEVKHIPDVNSKHVQRFLFDDEDQAFDADLVSVGPYDSKDKPLVEALRFPAFQDPEAAQAICDIDPNSIRMIQDLVLGDVTGFCDLQRREQVYDIDREIFPTLSFVYPFGHALCFKLLAAFSPRLMQPVGKFWATVRAFNDPKHATWPPPDNPLDLGDVKGSQQQYVDVFHSYFQGTESSLDMFDPNDNDVLPQVLRAVLNKETLDPADVSDYWLNHMYVWVRPDKFPIREAFEEPVHLMRCEARSLPAAFAALPLDVLLDIAEYMSLRDVLSLLSLCTTLRAKLAGCMDQLARRCLTWAVPSVPGEQERWDASLAQVDASLSQPFPWLAYARQCHLSPSMRNRQRIWGICQQYERLAILHGVL